MVFARFKEMLAGIALFTFVGASLLGGWSLLLHRERRLSEHLAVAGMEEILISVMMSAIGVSLVSDAVVDLWPGRTVPSEDRSAAWVALIAGVCLFAVVVARVGG